MATTQVTVDVRGMTCAGCVARIEQALRAEEGVMWARINFAAQQAIVTYDPLAFGPQRLASVIQTLGYQTGAHHAGGRAAGAPSAGSEKAPLVRPVIAGILAAALLVGFYLGLVGLVQDWQHARELLWGDRWLVATIAAGFGVQVGLYVYFRGLTALHHRLGQCRAITATGTGTSSIAMVACCAHHLADVLPILGLAAASTFLAEYRVPFMLAGIGANAAGILLMVRLIRSVRGLMVHLDAEGTAGGSAGGPHPEQDETAAPAYVPAHGPGRGRISA